MRLNKEDWEKLDELLGKIGFGGYFDFLETLRMTAGNMLPEKKIEINKEKDVLTLILLIHRLSRKKNEKNGQN